MKSRMFLLIEGKNVFIRGAGSIEVSFDTVEDFYKYYTGTIDLSLEYYIDYEPDRNLLYKSAEGSFDPLVNQWIGSIEEYENIIREASDMKSRVEDPYFELDLEQAKEYKRNTVKSRTYNVITNHMPEWRQLKWRDYMGLYERVQAGESLNALDRFAYDSFLDTGETHDSAYETCRFAFQWVLQCVVANNAVEQQVPGCTSIQAVKDLPDPVFPEWNF